MYRWPNRKVSDLCVLSPPLSGVFPMFRSRSAELGNSFVSDSPGSVSGASPGALSNHSGTWWGLELTWGVPHRWHAPMGVKHQACCLAAGKGLEGGRQQEPERYLQQTLEVLTWQEKCPCGWHLGKRKGAPLYYTEQQRTIKVMAGSGKSLFPLPLTLNSDLPKCIFTTEAKKLVTKRRDQWLLVAVKVAFGENVHFDDKKCHGDIAGSHLSVTADNSR